MKVLGRWKDSMLISAAGSQMLLAVVEAKTQARQSPQTFHHSTHNISGGQDVAPRHLLETWGKAVEFQLGKTRLHH